MLRGIACRTAWEAMRTYISIKTIWGNTRLTYSDDNGDGRVGSSEIRREQNYYPFGMYHSGYNTVITGVKNELKTYQGQEFTDDFDLNIHEWNYRISDPAIGRFWQIDPLAEAYPYNATYAFQENKLGLGVELEGLELGPPYWAAYTPAAKQAGVTPTGWQRQHQLSGERTPAKDAVATVGAVMGVGVVGVTVVANAGLAATGTFIANEAKDEALSQATGGLTDLIDLSKGIKNLAEYGFKKLDIGGGASSKYSDALNIDPNAESGFKGDLGDFVAQTDGNVKFGDITVDNPRFDFLGDASKLLEDGGTITVRGTMNNGFFKRLQMVKPKA